MLSSKLAKKVFAEMLKKDEAPADLVKKLGLEQVSDERGHPGHGGRSHRRNPQSVADYKAGKDKAIGFLVGQVMKKSRAKQPGHGEQTDHQDHQGRIKNGAVKK